MNLVCLQLKDCRSCPTLPPLVQLQSLKDLLIVKMDGVRKVGAELYGNNGCGSSSIKPFGSLVILRFEEMSEWEEWVYCGVEFPCLKELYIKKCPKLKKDLPKHLPKLTKLEISKCRQLMCCLPMAPSICELKLDKCKDVMLRSASSLIPLTSLEVSNVWKILVELQQLQSLVKLSVYGCGDTREMLPILHNLISLKHLEIKSCKNLSSLSEMGLPPMLEMLDIEGCPILKSLPRGISSLKELSISSCTKLELALPKDMTHNHYASLNHLVIKCSCDSLTSFPLGFFTKLEYLLFYDCKNLECLYIPDGLRHVDLTSLQSLSIYAALIWILFHKEDCRLPI